MGGCRRGPNLQGGFCAIYVWNLGTFDVQGVHPKTTAPDGSYADEYLQGLIADNNAAANAAYPVPIPAEVTLEDNPLPSGDESGNR
jgi:hypothetical protein